jgi:hypothetical protein
MCVCVVCVCVCIYISIYIYIQYIYIYMTTCRSKSWCTTHWNRHTHTYTHTTTHTSTHTHTYIHTYMHACYIHTYMHACIPNRNKPQPLQSGRLMYLRAYDIRDTSCKTAPSPSLHLLAHAFTQVHWLSQRWGYRNKPQLLVTSARLKYLSVCDKRVASIPSPLPFHLDTTSFRSTWCVRGFNILKLSALCLS